MGRGMVILKDELLLSVAPVALRFVPASSAKAACVVVAGLER